MLITQRFSRITWIGSLAVVAIVAAGLCLLGFHDVLLALLPLDRVIGAVLLATGLSAASGVWSAARGRLGRAAVALAFGAFGGLVLVAIQIGFRHDARTYVWLVVAFVPLGASLLARQRRKADTSWTETKVGIAVAAVTAVLVPSIGLLGGAFRPPSDAEVLDLDIALSVVGRRKDAQSKDYVLVRTEMTMKNVSKRNLIVFGSAYGVLGGQSVPRPNAEASAWAMGEELSNRTWSGRYEQPWADDLIEAGYDFYPPGNWLDAGQEEIISIVTPVPAGEINTVTTQAEIATVFGDRARLGEQTAFAERGSLAPGRSISASWELTPSSFLARITRGDPELRVTYEVESSDNPRSALDPKSATSVVSAPWMGLQLGSYEQKPSDPERYGEKVYSYYGVGKMTSMNSISLEEPPAPEGD